MPDDLFSSDDIQTASEAPAAPAEDSGPSPEVQEGSLETAAPTAPAATAQAGVTPSTQPAPKPQGPIPFDRHKAVLDNARKEYEQKYAWAQGINPEQGYQLAGLARALAQDPVATYRAIGAQLEAAGLLQGANGQQPPPPGSDKPQPDLITEDGRRVYSAQQAEALNDWGMKQMEQRIAQRFGPIEQQFQMSQVMAEANSTASQVLQEASQWPHFNECAVEIRDEMIRDKRLSLEGAYRRVVVPKLRQLERASVLKELKQKPSATTMNPGRRPTTAESPADTPWEDLLARTWDTMVGT
jgi:hypothetical protein